MALNKSGFGLDKGRGQARVWGRLPPPCRPLPLASVQALPTPGILPGGSQAIQKSWASFASPWGSLESPGLCEERINQGRGRRNREGSSGIWLELAPSSGLPLSRDCIPGLPSLGLTHSLLSSSRLLD